jgi:hypothetical protein
VRPTPRTQESPLTRWLNRQKAVEGAGLIPASVELLCEQMAHEGAPALAGWPRTTWLPDLDRLPE